jgi:cell volume regulation protein A
VRRETHHYGSRVGEIAAFGVIVLVVAAAILLALLAIKLTERVAIPAPAIFLLLAALASDLVPRLGDVSIRTVERIGVAALIPILFEGGLHVGWRRFRLAGSAVAALGVAGTFGVAAVVSVAAKLLGFDWTTAALLGAALAPTDPAVMFSVLGSRGISGKARTILEGEAGANDPVGIALVIGVLDFAVGEHASVSTIAADFVVAMVVGSGIGIAGAVVLRYLSRRLTLPSESLYSLRALAFAALVYGVASVAHGSGFLAVFVAGVLLGDDEVPHKDEVLSFMTSLASLAEIVVFIALGLTIHLADFGSARLVFEALVLALVLTFVARPLVVAVLLSRSTLTGGERLFVMWGGLRGAVPILLGAFALVAGVDHALRVYEIVFFVVAFSVIVQGTTIAPAARRLGVEVA